MIFSQSNTLYLYNSIVQNHRFQYFCDLLTCALNNFPFLQEIVGFPSAVATFSICMTLRQVSLRTVMNSLSRFPSEYHAPPVSSSEGSNSTAM
uniref:Putative ovule protein n=1 Tax=Solanum chacoense TaxID=4108 RepID=A0A0V0GPE7_SOLCH